MFTIGPPMWGGAADPFAPLVVALLRFNGANGSTSYVDNKGNSWANFGAPYDGAAISTARSKWGGSSLRQSGPSVVSCTSFGAGMTLASDFTMEGWLFMPASPPGSNTLAYWSTPSGDIIVSASSSSIVLKYGGDSTIPITPGGSLTNRWLHWFVGRQGGTKYVGADGLIQSSATSSSLAAPTAIFLGGISDAEYNLDDFRVTNGACRYTGATYEVPTAEFSP